MLMASAVRKCGNLSIVVHGAAAGVTTGDDCGAASPVTLVTVGPLLNV